LGAILSFLAWPVYSTVLAWLSVALYRPIFYLIPVLGLVSWGAVITAYIYRTRFKCPDCQKNYFMNDWLLVNPFRRSCRHCGYNLGINAKSDDPVPVPEQVNGSGSRPLVVDGPHRRTLRTVGTTLIVIGVLDIGLMIYSMMQGKSYSSSFNLFAVVLGIFLFCGSLRAANLTVLALAFILSAAAFVVMAAPFVFPPALILARVRQGSLAPGTQIAFGIALVAYVILVIRALRDPIVKAAQDAAGVKRPRLIYPILVGGALAAVILGINLVLQSGPAAQHAKQLAEGRVGPGYEFYISGARVSYQQAGRSTYEYTLSAWNAERVIDVQVGWANE
jgi:hypothetical protein